MASTILYKTAIMLILIGVGILCAKTGLISKSSNKDLSKFVLQVINPVVIFMSYQTDYRTELVRNLLLTFVIALGTMGLAIALSYVFVRRKEGRESEIERFSAVYSNCGFMPKETPSPDFRSFLDRRRHLLHPRETPPCSHV